MARPKIYDEPRVATAVRFPASLRGKLDKAAEARDVSVNFLVTRAVTDYLAKLPALDTAPARGSNEPRSVRRVKGRAK